MSTFSMWGMRFREKESKDLSRAKKIALIERTKRGLGGFGGGMDSAGRESGFAPGESWVGGEGPADPSASLLDDKPKYKE